MFEILVKRIEDNKVVRRIKAGNSEWQAAHTKIDVEVGLDHNKYYVDVRRVNKDNLKGYYSIFQDEDDGSVMMIIGDLSTRLNINQIEDLKLELEKLTYFNEALFKKAYNLR